MLHGVLRLKIKIKGCYSATIEGMGMLGEGGGVWINILTTWLKKRKEKLMDKLNKKFPK